MTKTFGGGELLRAVLESNAVDSMPFFYNVLLTGNDQGAAPFSFQSATIQTENDSAFLMTSVWGISSNSFVDQPEFFGVFDAGPSNRFVFGASTYFTSVAPNTWMQPNSAFAGLQNDSLAACTTLPEYLLWGPNSMIGVSWLGRNGGFAKYRHLVLGGIKYHLKGL